MTRGRRGGRLVVPCVLVLVSTLAGCDVGDSAGGPTPSTSVSPGEPTSEPSRSADPPDPVDLRFAVYGDDEVVAAYRRIVETFVEQAPHVDVEIFVHPDATSAANAVTAAAGSGVGPDLVLLDQLELPRLVEEGALAPLDEALDARGLQFGDDFQRSALTTFSADAQLQCMPIAMSPWVVYWNRQLVSREALEAQGHRFPRGAENWGWNSFEAAARAAAERDLLGPVKGTWLPPRLDLVTALVRSGGDDVVDDVLDPQSLTLSSEDAVETLAAAVRLASDPVVSLTPADLARRDAVDWFAAGELGLLVGTRDDLPRLRAAAEEQGLDFGVVSLPSFGRATSASEATGLCVSADSDVVEAAADLVAWAVGRRAARIVAATGRLVPTRLDTLTSDAFAPPDLPPRRSEAFAAGVKRSEPPPYTPLWPDVTSRVEQELRWLLSPAAADVGPRGLTRRLVRLEVESRVVLGTAEDADDAGADDESGG